MISEVRPVVYKRRKYEELHFIAAYTVIQSYLAQHNDVCMGLEWFSKHFVFYRD